MKKIIGFVSVMATLLLTGCAKPQPYDYTAFNQSKPRSILVMPPINKSPDINATAGFISQVSMPLAESGYYVLPVAVTYEAFKQNGITTAHDAQALSVAKLHQIFGADSALYMTITDYGTSYQVIASDTRVTAAAKLIDLRTGKQLWSGTATASSAESNSNSNNGILGMLVAAAVDQIAGTMTDKGHSISGITSARLLTAGNNGAILYGPYSPKYGAMPQ